MKVLGLIGGMSWESTVTYYQAINRRTRDRLGGLHSSSCIIHSFDFAEIEHLQAANDWEQAGVLMQNAAIGLQKAGANAIVICTNTMHKLAHAVEPCGLPLLHIADATASAIQQRGIRRVGLLGTRYTMEQDFYKSRLSDKYGLDVLIPNDEDRDVVHNVIYTELCNGIITEASREAYVAIIKRLAEAGAECVILGCTEIGLLIQSSDVTLPLFDTTLIHAEAAADWAIDTKQ
jgi:aspartate racemase